jgi:outer membrane protein TolC
MNDYSNALLTARADITAAVDLSKGTLASALSAIDQTWASKEEVESHMARFYDAFGDNPSLSNILNDLLDAENRLIAAENTWANRQIQHMQALAQIQYEAGTLMTISAE